MFHSWALMRDFGPYVLENEAPVESVETLIDRILNRYHAVHRAEFPEAIRLARKVEAVHRDQLDAPTGLADHLSMMFDDLQSHQYREELVLFPTMLQGGCGLIQPAIGRMMRDHEDVEAQLALLRALTRDHTPPSGACRTWRRLYEACAKLDADLVEHMRLENEELFTRFL